MYCLVAFCRGQIFPNVFEIFEKLYIIKKSIFVNLSHFASFHGF